MINTILKAIEQAQEGNAKRTVLETNKVTGKHEFLFFIKPELTLANETIQSEKIIQLILDKIEEFGLQIKNSILLPAQYLDEHNIIAQHYGIINAISKDAKANVSESGKKEFEKQFETNFADAPIFGSLELINEYPGILPTALDYIWQNSPFYKIGGGTYCQPLSFDGIKLFLVNGFHPRQLEHFIAPGRSIVAFTLVGDLDWSTARNAFIGKTNPSDAEPGSIRCTLLEQKDALGLQAVTSSWNGVHLSAGPVEGLIELIRYNSDFAVGNKLSYSDFSFGKMLHDNFNESETKRILDNVDLSYQGTQESVFDLTEEKNASDSIDILKSSI